MTTSLDPEAAGVVEPPPKRQKLSPTNVTHVTNAAEPCFPSNEHKMAGFTMAPDHNREAEVGIRCFVNESNLGFSGVLKQRYTDFLVNEVQLDGTVLHLKDLNAPKPESLTKTLNGSSRARDVGGEPESPEVDVSDPTQTPVVESSSNMDDPELFKEQAPNRDADTVFNLSYDDNKLLVSHFSGVVRDSIVKLHEKALQNPQAKSTSLGYVLSNKITDRSTRTKIHKDVRRIFNSRLETVSDAHGIIKITVRQNQRSWGQGRSLSRSRQNQSRAKLSWTDLGGEHLHFSLYKENKDTMEIISFMASRLQTNPRNFAFAGTKDRRAVTVQRVSIHRFRAENLAKLNPNLFSSRVGDFKYEPRRLELGDLCGNEFTITLRDCQFHSLENLDEKGKIATADRLVGDAVKNMQAHGFINYFGMQRFGTYTLGTDEVGKKILQKDFEGAVNAILAYSDDAIALALNPGSAKANSKLVGREDIDRAHAIYLFKVTGENIEALEKLPRKFSGEANIIRHLSRNKRDFAGALLQIPRNLRIMYVHAYQSLIWNMATSERWARFGDKVIEGDLVLIESESVKNTKKVQEQEVDENGEIIVLPAAHDTAISADDLFQRARPLTAEEAMSGHYSIFDIVLPTPGYDIEYPVNEIGEFYKEFMTSERGGKLDPGNMRRPQKDFSLSGSYRKILAKIGNNFSHEVRLYMNEKEQMIETDLEKINMLKQSHKIHAHSNHVQTSQSMHPKRPVHNGQPIQPRQPTVRGGSLENMPRNPWMSLPAKLAEDDKTAAALRAVQKLEESVAPKKELPQPVYKDTFVKKSGEDGQRTGHRETTLMESVEDLATGVEPGPNTTDKSGYEQKVSPPEQTQLAVPEEVSVTSSAENPAKLAQAPQTAEQPKKIAVIVKFQLGSSQYATMALRELMKRGGVQTYKPEFSSAR